VAKLALFGDSGSPPTYPFAITRQNSSGSDQPVPPTDLFDRLVQRYSKAFPEWRGVWIVPELDFFSSLFPPGLDFQTPEPGGQVSSTREKVKRPRKGCLWAFALCPSSNAPLPPRRPLPRDICDRRKEHPDTGHISQRTPSSCKKKMSPPLFLDRVGRRQRPRVLSPL